MKINAILLVNACVTTAKKISSRFMLFAMFLLFATTCHVNAQVALSWAAGFGSSADNEFGNDIAVDASGNVYITGSFANTVDFDPGPGVASLTSAGSDDIFILKLDAHGNFVYAKGIGSASMDRGSSIAVSASGNVYVTGTFQGVVDFDPDAGTADLNALIGRDIFILKLDASGNYVYAKRMGVTNYDDYGFDVVADASDNVYTTGVYLTTVDFDPGPGTYNLTSNGTFDCFIQKLDASGNFVYARSIGGSASDQIGSIVLDASGNLYLTGFFNNTVDFDPGAGIYELISEGGNDCFILKLDASGNYVYAKRLGSALQEAGTGIAVDASGNLCVSGGFQGTVDFDPGAGTAELSSLGDNDVFILKLDASGNYVYAKSIGSGLADNAADLLLDVAGNIYVTGLFNGTVDFDPGTATLELTSEGSDDVFILKLDAAGNFLYAKNMGGPSTDQAKGLAIDASGNLFMTGNFWGTVVFDPGTGTTSLTSNGRFDAFVVALSQPITVPLRWVGFNAWGDNGKAQLKWVVAEEQNVSHFEVERSMDGVQYITIGRLVPQSKTSGDRQYLFADNPKQGAYHYRIKLVNMDGGSEYSAVRKVKAGDFRATPLIYPVPATNMITINTIGMNDMPGRLNIFIYNAQGQLLMQQNMKPGTIHKLNVSGFTKGHYQLQLSGEKGYRSSHPIMVQ